MSSRTSDAVVVGAGIVGAACARALAREAIRVTVVESDAVGGGATATGMGHVVVMDDSEPQFALARYSQGLWHEIVDELPEDCEYEPCGTIWVAADAAEMDLVGHKERFYRQGGLAVEGLDAAALAEAEPCLRRGLAGGLRVPGDLAVYPPPVARWLLQEAQQRGADVRVGVSAVEITDQGVRLSDGSFLSAGLTINAAGAAAARLAPGLPLRPRKGHLVVTDRYPGLIRHQLIELGYLRAARAVTVDSVAFNVQPRITGQLLIGSSRQYGVETPAVDAHLRSRMIRRALEFLPRLAQLLAIRTWTGIRAATGDKLPLIGPCPGYERVYLATGHEGLGITMSLGTAGLLADRVMGRTPAIPPEPYLPSRFANGERHA